jgi:hypothetical protein
MQTGAPRGGRDIAQGSSGCVHRRGSCVGLCHTRARGHRSVARLVVIVAGCSVDGWGSQVTDSGILAPSSLDGSLSQLCDASSDDHGSHPGLAFACGRWIEEFRPVPSVMPTPFGETPREGEGSTQRGLVREAVSTVHGRPE